MKIPSEQQSPYGPAERRRRALCSAATSPHHRQGDRSDGDGDDAALPVHYLTGPQVCARYAATDMSLWRWLRDPKLNFPKPALTLQRRRLWRESDLIAWERNFASRRDKRREPA